MSRSELRWTGALCVLFLLTGVARGQVVALQDATVHPVKGPALTGATVIVRDGKIAAVGQKVAIPPGARTVSLKGQHLYPGLIDADTVLGMVEIGSVRGTQDTREVGRINPNLRAELSVNPDSELLPVARTGGVLLAHIVARSGLIAGTSALIYTQGWTWEDMTVKAPVFLHVRWPVMRIDRSGRGKLTVEEQVEKREKALRTLREAFQNARGYAKAQGVGVDQPADEDVKWERMTQVLRRTIRVSVQADDLTQIEAALDWARREQVDLVLVGGTDAWRVAKRLAAARVPVILGRVHNLPLRRYEHIHTPFRNAARLHEAGVTIAFSSGGSGFAASNSRNLKLHAATAVGHGLPRAAALRALTLGAAEILGVSERLGSIVAGKEATLIVTDHELLDFRARVVRAWIAGREVSVRDRQLRLYERYKARPRRR